MHFILLGKVGATSLRSLNLGKWIYNKTSKYCKNYKKLNVTFLSRLGNQDEGIERGTPIIYLSPSKQKFLVALMRMELENYKFRTLSFA